MAITKAHVALAITASFSPKMNARVSRDLTKEISLDVMKVKQQTNALVKKLKARAAEDPNKETTGVQKHLIENVKKKSPVIGRALAQHVKELTVAALVRIEARAVGT